MQLRYPLLLTFLASAFFSTKSWAIDQGDIRFSALAGNVSLLGDVGSGGQNSLGFGGGFSYLIADDLAFNILYLTSSHKNDVDHSDLSLGVDYYTGGDDVMGIFVSGGIGFLSNTIDGSRVARLSNQSGIEVSDLSGSGMGLFLGAGADFQVRPSMTFGIRFKYNKAFEANETVNNVEIKTVQDSIDVMASVSFVLPAKGW